MVSISTAFVLFQHDHYRKLQKQIRAERRARERQQEEARQAEKRLKATRMWNYAYDRGYADAMQKSGNKATLTDRFEQLGVWEGQAWSTTYGHPHGSDGSGGSGSQSHRKHHHSGGHHSSDRKDHHTGATKPATPGQNHSKGKDKVNKSDYLMSGALPQETPPAQTTDGGKEGTAVKDYGYRAAKKGVQAAEVKSQPVKSAMKATAPQTPHVSHQKPANPTKDSGHSGQKKSSSSEKGKNPQR